MQTINEEIGVRSLWILYVRCQVRNTVGGLRVGVWLWALPAIRMLALKHSGGGRLCALPAIWKVAVLH